MSLRFLAKALSGAENPFRGKTVQVSLGSVIKTTRSLNRIRAAGLQWATKVDETLLGNDAFRYLSICSILFASSVNSLIPPAPQFNVV